MNLLFCDRCGTEIMNAPKSETDEVTVSFHQPETGDDAFVVATICEDCSKIVFMDCNKWKKAQQESEIKHKLNKVLNPWPEMAKDMIPELDRELKKRVSGKVNKNEC